LDRIWNRIRVDLGPAIGCTNALHILWNLDPCGTDFKQPTLNLCGRLVDLNGGGSVYSVNGQSVARLSHSEVVRLISQSQGLIRVQVIQYGTSITATT
jgi:hypothetical protein